MSRSTKAAAIYQEAARKIAEEECKFSCLAVGEVVVPGYSRSPWRDGAADAYSFAYAELWCAPKRGHRASTALQLAIGNAWFEEGIQMQDLRVLLLLFAACAAQTGDLEVTA